MDTLDRTTDSLATILVIPGVALLIGIAIAVASWRAWTGRWRGWARWPLWSTMPIHLYPPIALFCLAYATDELLFTGGGSDAVWAIVLGASTFGTGLYLLAAMFDIEPRWATPRWFHDTDRSPDIQGDEVTALLALAARTGDPLAGRETIAEAFPGEPRVTRWTAALIHPDPDRPRDHPFSVPRGVAGWLEVYPSGIAFRGLAMEERLRTSDGAAELARVVRAPDLASVTTVPPHADADGVVEDRPRGWVRRLTDGRDRRVVVRTRSGQPLLLESGRANAAAAEIAARFKVERLPDL